MGISHIREYNSNIKRDFDTTDPYCVYLTEGQGCRTIWFKSVSIARKALFSTEGDPVTGADLVNCQACQCHYSVDDWEYKHTKPHICKEAKEAYAKSFEPKPKPKKQHKPPLMILMPHISN